MLFACFNNRLGEKPGETSAVNVAAYHTKNCMVLFHFASMQFLNKLTGAVCISMGLAFSERALHIRINNSFTLWQKNSVENKLLATRRYGTKLATYSLCH